MRRRTMQFLATHPDWQELGHAVAALRHDAR
jgi:hypothetical protein